jgi:hypothetical protein
LAELFSGMAAIKVVAWFLLVQGAFVSNGRQNLHHFFHCKRMPFHSFENVMKKELIIDGKED